MEESNPKTAEQLETVKAVASKLRAENQKKTEQMEKMQADLNFLEDRLREAKVQGKVQGRTEGLKYRVTRG